MQICFNWIEVPVCRHMPIDFIFSAILKSLYTDHVRLCQHRCDHVVEESIFRLQFKKNCPYKLTEPVYELEKVSFMHSDSFSEL